MKYLITGANGQLAKEFIKLLSEENIIALSHSQLDIADYKAVKEAINHYRPDVVINCAAYNKVDDAEKNWQIAYAVNGLGPRNLAATSNKIGAIIIHFSTDYVFDGKKKAPYTIADMPNPISQYGKSKLLGEEFIKSLNPRHIVIRTSWVFGEGQQNFVYKVLQWSKKSNILKISIDEVSSPTYAKDLAKATLDLLKAGAYGLYHITNQGYTSRYEYAKEILKLIEWNGEIKEAKQKDFNLPAKRPEFSALDNFGLKETIGYNLRSWKEALKEYINEVIK